MVPTATTVGAYLRDLPPDRRVAMARVCSMIRRSARGVRESMRYGLAFYELDGPLFALESGKRHMSLYVAEQEVVQRHKDVIPGVDPERSHIRFADLNRLPLDVVEKIVRDSVTARRTRVQAGQVPTQAELLKLWNIKEEAAAAPPPVVRSPVVRPNTAVVDAFETATTVMRDMMTVAFDMASGVIEATTPQRIRTGISRAVDATAPTRALKTAVKAATKPSARKTASKSAAPTAKKAAGAKAPAAPARKSASVKPKATPAKATATKTAKSAKTSAPAKAAKSSGKPARKK
ncbi:MAG: DUF1801 domain-containing protein [Betaproteobacteria bacterium]